MSKDLPQPQQSEEVDLGQLFKFIGKAFDRFFNFVGGIFNKLFLAFVWLVFFVKKNIVILFGALIAGFLLGYVSEKFSLPVYKSYVTVKQNYNTGENLYTSIAYYRELVSQGDTKTLMQTLNLSENQAKSILDFQISSVVSENEKLKNYNDYLKTIDSSLVTTSKLDYEKYIENSEDYLNKYQQISIKAKAKNDFKEVFDKIISSINNNEYFKREQQKDLEELRNEEEVIITTLKQSDSLQQIYKRVLEKNANREIPKGSQMSINIDSAEDKNQTKEYDLYKNDLQLRQSLVSIRRQMADKKYVVELISNKQDSGVINEGIEILGLKASKKKYYALLIFSLTFLGLVGFRFMRFLERFKEKI